MPQKLIAYLLARKKLTLFLFLLNFAGIAVATLWPFDFSSSNGVSWISNQNGIHFSHPGVLISSFPFAVLPSADNSATIELRLRTDENWSMRNVLGFYAPGKTGGLHIFQWNGGLLVSRGYPHDRKSTTTTQVYARGIFRRGQPISLTIASTPFGTAIYVNGEQKQFFPNFHIDSKNLSGQLVLGTAPADFSPWRGDIYLIALYSSALSAEEIRRHYDSLSGPNPAFSPINSLLARYSFSESSGSVSRSSVSNAPDLQIPVRFSVPYKPILQSPLANFKNTWHDYRGVLLNILGFIPYGFLLYACLWNTRQSRFAVVCCFLSGVVFSFLIEFTQGYIPQRDSGFNDVITNGLGALVGALLGALFSSRLRRTDTFIA